MRYAIKLLVIIALVMTSAGSSYAQDKIAEYVSEIHSMAEQVLAASDKAASASDVAGVKAGANDIFELIWGAGSNMSGDAEGAVAIHGWKTRWQVDNGHFDEAFAERNGVVPPEITDTQLLGIMGRGRAVRHMLQEVVDSDKSSAAKKQHAEAAIASLNNVIGWMKVDNGVTKGELQPRIDLTREWDAPSEFWLSTADTGWLLEVYSQAINILKVDYAGDVAEARKHAKGMKMLAQRVLEGLDSNKDGEVAAVQMEGGLNAMMEQVKF